MAKTKGRAGKAPKQGKTVVKSGKDGRFMGVRIADPAVKPRGTTVKEIRRAVASVLARRKHA
jgi:hypothetical protein